VNYIRIDNYHDYEGAIDYVHLKCDGTDVSTNNNPVKFHLNEINQFK